MANEDEILKYNSLTKTRFIMQINLDPIFGDLKKLKNFSLNCISVSTPEIVAGVSYQTFQGYSVPIPNGNRDEEKLLRIEFVVSETLLQYAVMLCWINKVTGQFEKTGKYGKEIKTKANIYALDSYLKPSNVPFEYYDIFITRLGSLGFDHSDKSGDIMKCSAEFSFYRSDLDYEKILED